jgi:HD-like signal output (HDOD) protein
MEAESSLVGMIDHFVASKKVKLPAFNATALRIQKEVAKAEPDSRLIEKLIVSDQSLTGEVLSTQVATVRDAIIRMGNIEVSNIVSLVALQHNFQSKIPAMHKIMGKLWRHSVGCAIGANWLARQTGFQALAHETFIAGLLHDVGKLYVLKVVDDMKASGEIENLPSDTVIDELMQQLHTDQGYTLMAQWNLPEKYCQVARDHHLAEFDGSNFLLVLVRDGSNFLLVLVRLANQVCHKMGIGLIEDPSIVLLETPEAAQLQLSEMDLARLEVRMEDSQVVAG